LVGCFASGDKRKTTNQMQTISIASTIHPFILFIPPHWKIDTVVIRRSSSDVIIFCSVPLLQQDKAFSLNYVVI
jgi:hypothetical protein